MNQYGYSPSKFRKLVQFIAQKISHTLRLDKPSTLTAEILQISLPYYKVQLPNRKPLKFLVNHGRLLWRAKTLLTEEPLIIEWLKNFDSSSLYLDIGSNVGNYVLLAKAYNPKLIVYAAELDFNNLYLMYHNLVINNLQDKVLILPFALIDSTRTCTINYRDLSQGDALQSVDRLSPFDTSSSKFAHSFSHLGASLDTIIHHYSLQQPSHIKIDVDGNELLLLEGAKNTLKNAKSIYFENSLNLDCNLFADFLINEGFNITRSETIYSKQDASRVNCINQIFTR